MNSNILLPLFYWAPISWYSHFLDPQNEVFIEQWENFPKQTYRNRANIYGANGKLPLIIPINHHGKREMRDIEVSYAEDWQKNHWKSLKIAYQSSPYFEFYENKIAEIYQKKEKFLLDINLKSIEIVQNILKTDKNFSLTSEYQKEPNGKDYREKMLAKVASEYNLDPYYQVFSDQLGFLKDLSVLDLICNKGPESLTYINTINKI